LFSSDALVFLLDYVGPADFVHRVAKQVKHVTLLDHHKTAFELIEQWKTENSLPTNFDYTLINEQSGATIAYEYFSKEKELVPDLQTKARLERMYAYIEDGDLWRKALPLSKEFSTGLGAKNIEWDLKKNQSLFLQLQLMDADKLIEDGKAEVERVNRIIDANLVNSFPVTLGGREGNFGQCLAVLTKNFELRSEMGHQLALKSQASGARGIGAIVYEDEAMGDPNKLKVSLRSIEDEDTTVISKHFGGGGHKNASSFMLDKDIWAQWKTVE